MKVSNILYILSTVSILVGCSKKEQLTSITISNSLDVEKTFETITLSKEDLKITDLTKVGIRDKKTGKLATSQLVDLNGDNNFDQLLFQPKVAAKSSSVYELVSLTEKDTVKPTGYCFSRFVPERTDDYAWENNRIAFRVYGPTAQKMVEDSIEGGTMSSGVDAWLKKVEYPIINKWYKEHVEKPGAYHIDTGEGLDNFHVGISRGVGGIAVKSDTTYFFSKNYAKWKTITNGPIRTSFYLEYQDWDANGLAIKESKVISLDYGSNLSKFETHIEGTNTISAGLTLHEKDGVVKENLEKGWISYWQPHAESEIGTAIVTDPANLKGAETYNTEAKDLSNAYAHLDVKNNTIVYYAGFAWKESGQFKTKEEWENYLSLFSKKMKTPLEVSINTNGTTAK